MKEAYPLEVAEYCQENNLLQEPAIAWWANYTIKKRNQIISKVKAKVKKRSLKYGIQVPRTVREALMLDEAKYFLARCYRKRNEKCISCF